MLNKSQFFNYLTLILAIITICLAIWTIVNRTSPIICIILMCIMLVSNHISKKINEKNNDLTKEEKEILNKIKNKSEEK